MKKQLFSVLSFLMLCIGMQAQTNIANYTFASSAGTYVPLTGATTFTNSWDDNVSAALPLGGTFTYGAATYTACFINSNGYITFGTVAPTTSAYTPLSTLDGQTGAIAAYAQDAASSTDPAATPSISYMNIGGATGEFVVQFTDHANYYGRATERLNFQIRLNLATGAIKIVYGSWTAPNATATQGLTSQVGIRGNTVTWTTNVNSLNILNVPAGTSCNWANAITSNANNNTMLFSNANNNVVPTNGLTYTWAPPAVTLAPVRVFTAVSGITASGATINWTAPTGATQYNVQYRLPGSCSWTNFTGNPVATNSATLTGLTASTIYQVRVQSSDGTNNAIWSHIPNAAGTGNGYSAASTFTTAALATDLQTIGLIAPAVNATGCYGSSIPVVIQIKNAGSAVLDFSTNNATVITNITGTNPQSYTTSVSTGTLAANATLNVTVTPTYNMSAAGVYNINAISTLATPDANTSNDAMAVATRTTTAPAAVPFFQDFSAGTTTPVGWTNPTPWAFAANHGLTNNGMYFNLYNSATTASVSLPKMGPLTGLESITFDFRILNYSATYPGVQAPPTPTVNWGSLRIQVSSDCGTTYSTIATIDNSTYTVSTGQAFANKAYSLSSFAGQNVIIRVVGTWVAGDYFIDLDNFNIASCFAPTNITYSNVAQTSADIAWVAPITGSPASYIYEVRTSGAAGSGTTGIVSTGTVTAPTASVSVSGLTAITGYSVYVMSNCGPSNTSMWTASSFTTLANCQVPTALNTTSVMATSATFTWVAGASETAWDVYYGVQPLTVPTATTAPTATTSVASYMASALTQTTAYSVYVRANCGAGNTSIWTAVNNFTTPASCPVPSTITISAITPTSAVATWTAGTTETSWLVKYSAPTMTAIAGPTPSYTMAGLTPSMNYSVQVKGICAVGDSSVWTVVKTFATPCLPPNVINPIGSTRCGNGTTTLTATADMGGTISWYAAPTGGAALATGTLYTTPTITTTTTYYAAAIGGLTTENVGRVSAASATGFLTTPNWGIQFSTTKQVLINSVTVYPIGTGSVTIAVLNSAGVELMASPSMAVTGTGTNTPVVLNLGFSVPQGTDYKLVLKAYSGITDLIRDPSGSVFPYTSASGALSVTAGWTGTATSASYYWFYNLNISSGCESARTAVTATVTTPNAVTLSSPSAICAGSGIATLSVTSNTSDYDSYVWAPTTGLYTDAAATVSYTGSSTSMVYANSNTAGTLNYNVTANNSVSGCATAASASVSILEAPTNLTVVATPSALCAGSTVTVSAAANNPAPTVVFADNFNAAVTSWSITDNSSAVVAGLAWHLAADGTSNSSPEVIHSNDNSQFMFTDANTSASSLTVNTTMTSPAFNTQGLQSANLDFYHYYYYGSATYHDDGVIRMSTDNISWTTVKTYTTNQGAPAAFAHAIIPVPAAFLNQATVYVQFQSIGGWGYYWHVDNVSVSGVSALSYNYNWTAAPAGFTAATATATDMPMASTVYSVVITNTNTSCSNSGSVAVNVNAIPTVTASASSTSVCAGSSATLTAGGATSYIWTSGGNTSTEVVTPASTSVYTVTGSTSGCSSTATVSVDVTATPTVMATATVTATEMGCSTDAFVTVNVSNCTGVKNSASSNGISVYPNPTNGIVNISISSELNGATTIEVYDALGKLVITEKLTKEITSVNTSKLEDGIYMFKIINNNQSVKVGRLIKQ